MPTESRIQDDPGLAGRYLAGQLEPSELQAYEQHLLENPDAVKELEATARLKVGLANLRETGQLDGLLRAKRAPFLRWPALTAAAALLVLAVGLWRSIDTPVESTLVAVATELVDRTGRPLALGSSYALMRTRSAAYDAVVELPSQPQAIELRVRPETVGPVYTVALSQTRPDGSTNVVGNVSGLQTQPDGFVRLYVDSSRLAPGTYELAIAPAQESPAASSSVFRVRVVPPAGSP